MTKTKNKLKIGFVLDTTLDVEDGVQQYILVLGDYLKSLGHEVHYIVGETKRKDIPNLHSMTKNYKVTFNGNKVIFPMPASKEKIKKLLNLENFDILHVQVPYSPFFAARVVKLASRKSVVIGTFHIFPYNKLAHVGTWLLGRYLQKNLKLFDGHIAVSPVNRIFAKRTFLIDGQVIPNMVKSEIFKPKPSFIRKNSIPTILYLGRLTERKGCQYLLNAVAQLSKSHPELKFEVKIAGKGELLQSLKKQCTELNIQKKVDFLGYVSNEQKIQLMQSADIAVFPSYSGESFGIVLLEAIAARAGVVIGGMNPGYASVLGTIPESLVDVKDQFGFADTLYHFMIDEKLRKSIYDQQQALIDQYDYKFVGNQVLKYYLKLQKQ